MLGERASEELAEQLPGENGEKEPKLQNKKAPFSPHRLRLPGDSAPRRRRRRPNNQDGGARAGRLPGPRVTFFSVSRAPAA